MFIVFPIPAPYFGQIPNPENTLPDPVYRVGKSKVVEKHSKMCVQTTEKDSDGRIVKKLHAASNFVYKPVHQVMGAKDGYVMKRLRHSLITPKCKYYQ